MVACTVQDRRNEAYTGYAGAVICALVLLVVWVIALDYVPEGWPVIAVNGGGYALSIIVMAGGYDQLKRALRPFQSFLIAAATWAVVFMLVRELLLWLFR